jgi:biopolymer transport protein ExbB
VEGRRSRRQDHARHPRSDVDRQLVHHRHQGVRAAPHGRFRQRDAARSSGRPPSVRQGAEGPEEEQPVPFIAESGIEATTKHDGLLGNVELNEWITMSIQRAIENVQSRTQDGLAFLATVGSTAPFIGLFGTVWGIYHALTAIGIAGQASIDKVAGPVGEALIMTAIGLAVAVPAVLGYNWLIRRNKAAMDQVRGFGADLHAVLLSAAKTPPGRNAMAMSVGQGSGEEDEVVSTINTTPLVDVMLVLLIIFLITIPVVTTSVPVTLPKERNEIRETKPENIVLSVDAKGAIYWNDLRIPTQAALLDRLKKISVLDPQPEIQVRGDGAGGLQLGRAASSTRRSAQGIAKVGFITEPAGPRRQLTGARNRHGNERGTSREQGSGRHDRHQHHAAHRRDAGAAGHADHHAADPAALGQPQHADG